LGESHLGCKELEEVWVVPSALFALDQNHDLGGDFRSQLLSLPWISPFTGLMGTLLCTIESKSNCARWYVCAIATASRACYAIGRVGKLAPR
jgi:hypothetical protein